MSATTTTACYGVDSKEQVVAGLNLKSQTSTTSNTNTPKIPVHRLNDKLYAGPFSRTKIVLLLWAIAIESYYLMLSHAKLRFPFYAVILNTNGETGISWLMESITTVRKDDDDDGDWTPNVVFGNYSMPITFAFDSNITTCDTDVGNSSELIQRMFDVGLMESYGFAFFEARKTANRILENDCGSSGGFYCPMCQWLLAMGHSPYINHPIIPNQSDYEAGAAAAFAAFEQAHDNRHRRQSLSVKEAGLIDAMNLRFHPSFDNQTIGYNSYSERLESLHQELLETNNVGDADVMGFLADSIMILHSDYNGYHFYEENDHRTPKPRIRYAIKLLEDCLELQPDHPLCQHLYIHITEPSADLPRSKAGNVADNLSEVAHGSDAQHLQHMPSHTYLRIGRYHDAVVANVVAHDSDERYGEHSMIAYGPAHDMAFLVHAAQLSGERTEAYKYADALRDHYRKQPNKPDGPGTEEGWHIWRTLRLRFGDYDSILKDSDRIPGNYQRSSRRTSSGMVDARSVSWPYAIILGHYTKGIATLWNRISNENDNTKITKASNHLKALSETISEVDPSYSGMTAVANWMLEASIDYYRQKYSPEKQYDRVLELLQKARLEQESWVYTEPPSWYTTIALCEGTLLRIMGRFEESIKAFQDDLKRVPENRYGLYGLKLSMVASGTATESEIQNVLDRYHVASAWSDVDESLHPPWICPELGE